MGTATLIPANISLDTDGIYTIFIVLGCGDASLGYWCLYVIVICKYVLLFINSEFMMILISFSFYETVLLLVRPVQI